MNFGGDALQARLSRLVPQAAPLCSADRGYLAETSQGAAFPCPLPLWVVQVLDFLGSDSLLWLRAELPGVWVPLQI